jgi:phage baseplate assembly protein W
MPLEKTSKGFKDLSMSFQMNPLNNDLIQLKNENAISRSIRNLVLTLNGERFYNQTIGSNVSNILFNNIDPIEADNIRSQIKLVIENYEPRVVLNNTIVIPNYDDNQFDVTIIYTIVGIDALPQELSFALLPTR